MQQKILQEQQDNEQQRQENMKEWQENQQKQQENEQEWQEKDQEEQERQRNNSSRSKVTSDALTVVVMSGQVLPVYKEVMVLVQLPELAVDHIEVLVAEEVGHLVDVILILE